VPVRLVPNLFFQKAGKATGQRSSQKVNIIVEGDILENNHVEC